jgi:hypothetical protein
MIEIYNVSKVYSQNGRSVVSLRTSPLTPSVSYIHNGDVMFYHCPSVIVIEPCNTVILDTGINIKPDPLKPNDYSVTMTKDFMNVSFNLASRWFTDECSIILSVTNVSSRRVMIQSGDVLFTVFKRTSIRPVQHTISDRPTEQIQVV